MTTHYRPDALGRLVHKAAKKVSRLFSSSPRRRAWSPTGKITSITILGKRWFNRGPGNTYNTADIYVNGRHVHKIPFGYGYGEMWEQRATEWLDANGYIQLRHYQNGGFQPLWQYAKDNGIHYERSVVDVSRKKDLSPRRARSPKRAAVIRGAYDAFEKARETFDPKRFKRGGGYTPEDYAAIARAAGLKKRPSNRAMGRLELYEFKANPPEHVFAYYHGDAQVGSKITAWPGDILGHVTWRGQVVRKWNGGKTVAIRMKGVNGCTYAGSCNLTGGTYCRLKKMKDGR